MEEKIEKNINILSDIAKDRKIGKSLKGFEGFKFLAENIKDIIFIQDLNLNIIYISPSVEETFGYKREELIGKNARNFFLICL
jgi:PAS domain-containing protein